MSTVPVQNVLKNHELRIRSLEKNVSDISNNIINDFEDRLSNIEGSNQMNKQDKNEPLIEKQKQQINNLNEELLKNNKLTYLIKQELEKQINYNIEINRLYNLFHSEFLELKQQVQNNDEKDKSELNNNDSHNNVRLDISEKKTKQDLKTAIENSFSKDNE